MWIFRNDAMLSVVENWDDPTLLLVRSRQHGDIEKVFPNAETFSEVGSDYRYRAWIDRKEVAQAVYDSVMNIDYYNFKGSMAKNDYPRKRAYYGVWEAMHRFQLEEKDERFY